MMVNSTLRESHCGEGWKAPSVRFSFNDLRKVIRIMELAIVVSCLASFRTLYIYTDRSNVPRLGPRGFQRMPQFGSDSQGIPLSDQGQHCTVVAAGPARCESGQEVLRASFEALTPPLNAVHIQQDSGVHTGLKPPSF